MHPQIADNLIEGACACYLGFLNDGHWTLEHAHEVLRTDERMTLFQIAGLAKAIMIVQCE